MQGFWHNKFNWVQDDSYFLSRLLIRGIVQKVSTGAHFHWYSLSEVYFGENTDVQFKFSVWPIKRSPSSDPLMLVSYITRIEIVLFRSWISRDDDDRNTIWHLFSPSVEHPLYPFHLFLQDLAWVGTPISINPTIINSFLISIHRSRVSF